MICRDRGEIIEPIRSKDQVPNEQPPNLAVRVLTKASPLARSTALETPWLACNNIWWAGFYPSDMDRYCRSGDLIRLTDTDYEAARRLLEHPSDAYINNRVRDELAILVDRGAKVELDAISHDIRRLV